MTPLRGIRVVSFNHFLMGPAGVQYLADLGADVITVEPLKGAFQRNWGGHGSKRVDGESMLFLAHNRNKRSLALDLKDPRGLEIAKSLIASADIVAENFRPGVMESLGIGFEDCKKFKPDIIFASGSGFGADGPYVDRPGQDLIIQAMSGLAMITGSTQHGPRAVGVSVVDHHAGALYFAGMVTALLHKQRTGEGMKVDVSLLSAALNLQTESITCYANGEKPDDIRQPYPLGAWYFEAPYGVYPTQEGHIALSLGSLSTLQKLVGIPEAEVLADKDSFTQREKAAKDICDRLVAKPTAHWIAVFTEHKIWHSAVNDYEAVFEDPQVKHTKGVVTVEGSRGTPLTLVNHPIRYNGTAPEIRMPPQRLGMQTVEILKELNYTDDTIEELLSAKVIGKQ
jgi:crotonobetainyl-CoA:carnitine CoA-transferase CaiB-like acyl-CoA transferase